MLFDQRMQDFVAVAIPFEHRNDQAGLALVPLPGGQIVAHFRLVDRGEVAAVLLQLPVVGLAIQGRRAVEIDGADRRMRLERFFELIEPLRVRGFGAHAALPFTPRKSRSANTWIKWATSPSFASGCRRSQ